MKALLIVASFLVSVSAQAQFGQDHGPKYVGIKCEAESGSGKKIEIAAFTNDASAVLKKFEEVATINQAGLLQDDGTKFTYDLVEFKVGMSGIAGRNVKVSAEGNEQVLNLDLMTGVSGGNGNTNLKISKPDGTKLLDVRANCKLLHQFAINQENQKSDNPFDQQM